MLPPRPLVITLDDGSESVFKLFAPRALKRRLPYTLALVTGWLSETDQSNHATPEPGEPDPTMTWAQAKELYDSGLVEVVSHSDGLHYQAGEMFGSDEGLPAETIRQFLVEKNRVETEAEYERRIRVDMDTSRRKLIDHDFGVPSHFLLALRRVDGDGEKHRAADRLYPFPRLRSAAGFCLARQRGGRHSARACP